MALDPNLRVAVVGARGAVGIELLRLLRDRKVSDVRLFGSTEAELDDGSRQLALTPDKLDDRDLVFLCTPSDVARELAPLARDRGCLVIDNSSAFRSDPAIPLVIPEINPQEIPTPVADGAVGAIVANPNCSTILMLLAVAPLHRAFGCKRVEVTTYQAVSGAGREAMEELLNTTRQRLDREEPRHSVFPHPVAFNVFSHDSDVDPETGFNGEEIKIARETARFLGDEVAVAATCVRVPVLRSHCEALNVELAEPAREEDVRSALAAAPGVVLRDDRSANRFPTALDAAGRHEILVGRIRPDRSRAVPACAPEGAHSAFHLFLAGDQLLKGAALNALQIAEVAFVHGSRPWLGAGEAEAMPVAAHEA